MSKDRTSFDRDLICRCAAGDPEAWEKLVQAYTPLLAGTISHTLRRFGLLPEPALVQDLLQETWLSLARNRAAALRAYDPERSLEAYLAVVAARRCVDWLRKESKAPDAIGEAGKQPWETWLREDLASLPAPSEGKSADELRGRVAGALDQLPARERLALHLVYWEEFPAQDVGRILKLSTGAVWTLLTRARQRLQTLLREGLMIL